MRLVQLVHCLHVLTVHLFTESLTELIELLYNILLLHFKSLNLFLIAIDFLNGFSEFKLIVKTLRFQVLFECTLFLLILELILNPLLEGILVISKTLTDSA